MSNNNLGRGNEDGEDDFEDFGGFETADPVPDMAASQAQAAASPWALFNAGNAPDRPDLLCAQNRFPNCLDPSPSDISGQGAGADMNLNNASGIPPDLPQADLLGGQILGDQARIAENVLDVTLNSGAGVPGFHSNGRLPDLGLGNNENRLFGQVAVGLELMSPHVVVREASADPAASLSLELPNNAEASLAQRPVGINANLTASRPVEAAGLQDGAGAEVHADGEMVVVGGGCAGAVSAGSAEQGEQQRHVAPPAVAEAAARESDESRNDALLQQRLSVLTEENQRLEEELSRCRGDLATQRSRTQEMEERHEAAMGEIRKAGHDALAVVVEQYKEQVKVVVLEQQEESRRQIAEAVREQMRVFQDMMQAQREQGEEQKKEDKEELSRQIKQAVEQSRHEQQEHFQAFLTEERQKQKEAAEKVLEEERKSSEEKVQEFMVAEEERGRARLEEARTEASEKLDEERKSHETALASIREEEKRLAQEQMADLARAERERSREVTQAAVEACRLESRAYLQEQRQANSRVRQRHLASLDLFLESSRQQIALLMETDRPAASSSSSSASSLQPAAAASAPTSTKSSAPTSNIDSSQLNGS